MEIVTANTKVCVKIFLSLSNFLPAIAVFFPVFQNNFGDTGFLTMEPITMAPIQIKMIEPSLLTEAQV